MGERSRRSEVQVLRREPGESVDDYWLRCRQAMDQIEPRHDPEPAPSEARTAPAAV
jgi:hypothetical protein